MRLSSITKYRNKITVVDGIRFHSKKEANRYCELRMLGIAFDRQVKYPLYVNKELICNYVADFVYKDGDDVVVEDVKGVKTPEYKLKKKLMKAIYHIEIKET